ncbi:MAG: energy-coupling factor transporter transmembrane component T [Actinomycetota bacterium]
MIAWLVWTLCSVIAIQLAPSPIALGVAAMGMIFTAAKLSIDRGPLALMLKIGIVMIVVRVVLFGLSGHVAGQPTLFTMPSLTLPSFLGGFRLGGAISTSVVETSAQEGLRLAAMLLCFGVFLSIVEPVRVLRLVPRFLFEAGMIVAIAINFVPSIVRTARDVREAQQLRGHRARGVRMAAAIALPVLSTTIERSSAIAESMESRGFGVRARSRYRNERVRVADLAMIGFSIAYLSLALSFWNPLAHVLIAAPVFVDWADRARLQWLSRSALAPESETA